MVCLASFIFVIHIGIADAHTTSSICLNKTADESQCKNCCDCLEADAATRRSCRDACAVHDFSVNSELITIDVSSRLGPDGDYSAAVNAGSEQACKEYCDGSDELACGDRHYCRDVCNSANFTHSGSGASQTSDNRGLPPEIVAACQGKSDQAVCQVGGTFTGTCHTLQNQLACVLSQDEAPADLKQQWDSLDRNHDGFLDVNEARGDVGRIGALATIGNKAIDAMRITGKNVEQPHQTGKAGSKTAKAAVIALNRRSLIALAQKQVTHINEFGYQRFPLMKAFRRQLQGDIPTGSAGLDKQAVIEYSAELYRLDGQLSFQRAQALGSIIRSLDREQRDYLDKMAAGNSLSWPDLPGQPDKRKFSHEEHVAVLTYASEMFSWYAGSVEADTYFCPERHGMYFGAFYMKDIPAMGNPDDSISTQITGESGDAFLSVLHASQRDLIVSLVDVQREALHEIVATRRALSGKLRQFMQNDSVDEDAVLALAEKYGKLDGEISYSYATHFAEVNNTLSNAQKEQLMTLRNLDDFSCNGAYLYSKNIATPNIIHPSLYIMLSTPPCLFLRALSRAFHNALTEQEQKAVS